MVQLIVTVRTRHRRTADYVAAFEMLASHVRSEEGCLEYGIYVDSEDSRFDNQVRPDTVVLVEKWASIQALQVHTCNSPALDDFRKKVKGIKLESSYVLLRPAVGEPE